MDKRKIYGISAALIANLIFGFSFIFSKLALSIAHPLIILSVRFTVAFIFMNILVLTGYVKINFKGKRKLKLILMGIAQPLLYFTFELYGLTLVSSALSGIILALVPVAVMILATLFLKEVPSILQIICTAVSIISVGLISLFSNNNEKSYFLGVILLLLAVVTAATFNILSRSEAVVFSPFERTYVMFLIGTIGFNIIGAFVLKNNYLPLMYNAVTNAKFIIALFYLSVLSSVIAFLLYNYSTSVISVIQSSSFSNIITVVSVIAGITILHEHLSTLNILLCILIVLSVWGVNYFPHNK